MALLICCALLLIGVNGTGVSIAQFVPLVILIVSVPLLADIALSGVVPGASDNASGVATVLRLADRYGEELDSFDVWVVFTGAQESMQLGMAAFLRRHRRELDPKSTVFVCVDNVGNGTVRFATKEGYVLALPYHPELIAICEQLREEDADDGYYGARPVSPRIATDAFRARARGYPAIAISCADDDDLPPNYHQPTDTPANVAPEALERAFDFCSELIELIDERIGPRLEEPVGSVA
jgi:Iap family predicted aminopeptidase